MKKNIIIVLLTIIFISLLLYFYDKKEAILNKEYIDEKNNIHIEYPYFNNKAIDKYISNYLNKIILNNESEKLFVDYDYTKEEELTNLSIYVYKETDTIMKKTTKNLEIDLNNNYIVTSEKTVTQKVDYDFYKQKVIDKEKPLIALTFDDGPNHNTSKVLDILEKYNVKATFFILGTNIKGNEKIIKRMNELDMEIANHMYSHKLASTLTNKEIEAEITKTDQLLFNITKKKTTLLRPSYGSINNKIKNQIHKSIITWNIDPQDWKYHNSKRISSSILKKAKSGDIVLMHDIYSATANSLNITIPALLEQGFQLVTISELFYYNDQTLAQSKIYNHCK